MNGCDLFSSSRGDVTRLNITVVFVVYVCILVNICARSRGGYHLGPKYNLIKLLLRCTWLGYFLFMNICLHCASIFNNKSTNYLGTMHSVLYVHTEFD